MNENSYAYRPLFGHAFLTIQKFFTNFRGARRSNGEESSIICLMGTPSAAFRVISVADKNITNTNPGSFNGQATLPLLNFVALDFRRVFGMENPYARISDRRTVSTNSITGRESVEVQGAPQVWNVSFQCSLWTNGYKERDDLMSKILTTFRHEVGLKWYHDPVEDPGNWTWIILRMEESFTDDSNLEELGEKDSRKLVRSSWTMTSMLTLPYDINELNTIKSIQVSELNAIEDRLNSNLRWDCIDQSNGNHLVVFNRTQFFPVNNLPIGF
jgi:hypothetical protein